MQSPIRQQLRIPDRWHAQQLEQNTARLFVPGPWAEKRVVLRPGSGQTWSAARVAGQPLNPDPQDGTWQADARFAAGQWNTFTTEDGDITGAHLIASSALYISSLEATMLSDRCVSIRIRLASDEQQSPRAEEAKPLRGEMLTLFFTLTSPTGEQIGGMEVTVSPKSRGLSIEMPLPYPISGAYRLKASLSSGDTVIDNARIALTV